MFKHIRYSTLILFIESFLVTQEIIDILVRYYCILKLDTNNNIVSKLQEICDINGLEYNDNIINTTTIDTISINTTINKINVIILCVDISDLRSLLCTSILVRKCVLDSLDVIRSRYNLRNININNMINEYLNRDENVSEKLVELSRIGDDMMFMETFDKHHNKLNKLDYYRILKNSIIKFTFSIISSIINKYIFKYGESKELFQYVTNLSITYDKSYITTSITNTNITTTNFTDDYIIDLMNKKDYITIHKLLTTNLSLIKPIVNHIRVMFQSKDKDAMCKIFLPLEGCLTHGSFTTNKELELFMNGVKKDYWNYTNINNLLMRYS